MATPTPPVRSCRISKGTSTPEKKKNTTTLYEKTSPKERKDKKIDKCLLFFLYLFLSLSIHSPSQALRGTQGFFWHSLALYSIPRHHQTLPGTFSYFSVISPFFLSFQTCFKASIRLSRDLECSRDFQTHPESCKCIPRVQVKSR